LTNAIWTHFFWVANDTYYGLNYCFDATKKMDGLWYQKIKIAEMKVANMVMTYELGLALLLLF